METWRTWWPADAGIVKFERWRAGQAAGGAWQGRRSTHLGREVRQMLSRHAGGAAYVILPPASGTGTCWTAARSASRCDNLLFNFDASTMPARGIKVYPDFSRRLPNRATSAPETNTHYSDRRYRSLPAQGLASDPPESVRTRDFDEFRGGFRILPSQWSLGRATSRKNPLRRPFAWPMPADPTHTYRLKEPGHGSPHRRKHQGHLSGLHRLSGHLSTPNRPSPTAPRWSAA